MVEGADVLVAEQCCNRLGPVHALLKIAPGELAADAVDQSLVARSLLAEPPDERAAARAEAAGHAVDRRRPVGQELDDHGLGPGARIVWTGQRCYTLAADLLQD